MQQPRTIGAILIRPPFHTASDRADLITFRHAEALEGEGLRPSSSRGKGPHVEGEGIIIVVQVGQGEARR